jgi:hypothetical protein
MSAKAAPVFHWKATALFPVQTEEPDPKIPGGTIIKKVSLGSKELINLALGQPLKTKNPDLVLAVEANHDDPNNAKLVVYNSHTLTTIVTLFTLLDPISDNVASKDGDKGTANGLSRGRIAATVLGTPAQDGLAQTDVCCSATAGLTPTAVGPNFKLSVTGIVGPIQGFVAGVSLDGLIIKGMFTASGRPIDHF